MQRRDGELMADSDWKPFDAEEWVECELLKVISDQAAPMLDSACGADHPQRAKRLSTIAELIAQIVRAVESRSRDRIDAEAATKH
jgi:hypothetical protein